LVLATHRITRQFPPEEPHGLTPQSRRAAFSAAANLVEGSAKRGTRNFARFPDIAIGSLAELSYALRLARELGYLTPYEEDDIERLREQSGKAVWGLYESLRRPRTADCR
jgi:four helix bundle protein